MSHCSRLCPRVAGATALVAALALAGACSGRGSDPARTPPAPVAVARVTEGPIARAETWTAELRPYQDVDVHAKVAGYVQAINVDVGDRVKSGQVLAVLEIPEMADEVDQANAAVGAAESDVTRAQAEVTRAESAHDVAHVEATRLASVAKSQPGLVAQQEIDDVVGRDKVAEAQLATASAALAASRGHLAVAKANQARTEALYAYSRITAPFTGVITKRYADTGTMIQAGTSSTTQALPLVRLAQDDRLRLVIPVSESAVAKIHVGGSVDVKVSSVNKTFKGTVSRFSDQVDVTARTMHVEVNVDNPTHELIPGMYAEATVVLDAVPRAVIVPATALDRTETGATVLRVNQSNALERKTVTLGIETADGAQVLSGLAAGDLVVVGPRGQLHAGQVIDPKPAIPAAAGGN